MNALNTYVIEDGKSIVTAVEMTLAMKERETQFTLLLHSFDCLGEIIYSIITNTKIAKIQDYNPSM